MFTKEIQILWLGAGIETKKNHALISTVWKIGFPLREILTMLFFISKGKKMFWSSKMEK